MTLSRWDTPSILSNSPALTFARLSFADRYLLMISFTNELFPLPDTPVTQVKVPSGILTSIFFRLFCLAPFTVRNLPLPLRLSVGTGIFLLPLRYCPVIERSQAFISSTVPCATTSPPCMPAPGPISTIWSAAYMVSSSCSTTISVLPRSRRRFNVAISLSLSLWCRPMDGSSRI